MRSIRNRCLAVGENTRYKALVGVLGFVMASGAFAQVQANTLTFEQQFFTQHFFSGGQIFQGTIVDVHFPPTVDEAEFPLFDPAMGTLQRVDVTLRSSGILDVQVRNLESGIQQSDWSYSLGFQLNLTDPVLAPVHAVVSASQARAGSVTLGAEQQTIVSRFAFNKQKVFRFSGNNTRPFRGTGSFSIAAVLDSAFSVSQAAIELMFRDTPVVLATVSYTFAPPPTSGLQPTAVVTTATDVSNAGDGVLSLREAIARVQAGGTITFDPRLSGQTLRLTQGQYIIGKNLTITGLGASSLIIDGNNASRVLAIAKGVDVTISGVTITGGLATEGGGIFNSRGGKLTLMNSVVRGNRAEHTGEEGGEGGGIFNGGRILLLKSTVSDNLTDAFGEGGGISNGGSLTIQQSTVSGNMTDIGSNGGGILNRNNGVLTVSNSTIGGNVAGSQLLLAVGGGLFNSGVLTVTNSTISDNMTSFGGGIYNIFGTATLTRTLVAGNTADVDPDCHNFEGRLTSQGYNLVSSGMGCPSNGPVDVTVPPEEVFATVLTPLQDHGGPTKTHALQLGSPAIDAGGMGCPSTDQRGIPRPQGPACDIGAVEFDGVVSTTSWQSLPFAAQERTFTATFETVPYQNRMNGITGLAPGPVRYPENLAVIVRFNPAGFIDARNGGTYTADNPIPYTAGMRYHIRLVVNMLSHTYSVYVRPEGGTEQALGINYAFRTEQQLVGRLNTWALRAFTGHHTVRNFTLQ
jgi:hypothetical protein